MRSHAKPAEWTGPRCEKCEAPMKSDVVTICRSCGWYASLGTFVEVDPELGDSTDDDADAPSPQRRRPRICGSGSNLFPRWGWVIIASVLAVVVESIVARFATPAESALRTTWSLTQLAIGVLAFVGCHIFNFLTLVADDADVGLLDLVLKPLKLWMRTLPATCRAAVARQRGRCAA